MPYQRPTLSQLRQQVAADISSLVKGADGLLRRSILSILGNAMAGLANLHYGFLDWISKQAVPYSCSGEFLEGWAGFVSITREAATKASGTVTFTGTNGVVLPAGSLVIRSDQRTFITTANGTISSGTVTVPVTDETAGAAGNTLAGSAVALANGIAGISSSGVVAAGIQGGTDVELDPSLQARMLQRYQNPPQGGAESDYITWARQINGITRVWINRNGQGTGTVVVFFMMDVAESAHSGFPQGTDGVATLETRDTAATGDQLALANYLFPLQPVPALVYAVAPTAAPQNFTIAGLTPDTADMRTAINAAIDDVFLREGAPCRDGGLGGLVYMADIQASINAISGLVDFIITSPVTDITTSVGYLPTRGTVTYV